MTEIFTWRTSLRYPYKTTYVQRVLTTPMESGKEQRRLVQTVRRKQFACQATNISNAVAGSMETFFNARNGIYEAFYFSDPNDYTQASEAVGTGDASTVAFSLDETYIASTTETIAVNSVNQTRNVDYTVDNDTGVITFATAPGNALAVTAGYEFYSKVRCLREPNREDTGWAAVNYIMDFIEVVE